MDDQKTKLKTAKRYRYTDKYRMNARTAADGSVTEVAEYIGAYLIAQHTERRYRSVRILAVAVAGISFASVLLLLCIPKLSVYNGGMYVFVPSTASLIPLLYLILGTLKLPKDDRKLQEDVFRFAHVRIRRSSAGILVLLLVAMLLAITFFLYSGTLFRSSDILFFLLLLIPVLMNLTLFRILRALNYKIEEQS